MSNEAIKQACEKCPKEKCFWGGFVGDCAINKKLRGTGQEPDAGVVKPKPTVEELQKRCELYREYLKSIAKYTQLFVEEALKEKE